MRSSAPLRPLHALFGVMLCGAASGWLGCRHDCTLIGCLNGVDITLREPLSSSDEYTVRIETADEQFECTSVVGPVMKACTDIFLATSDGQLTGLTFYNHTPSSLHLSIESNGVVLVDTDVQGIRYRSYYVNGEDCDDEPCRSADVQL